MLLVVRRGQLRPLFRNNRKTRSFRTSSWQSVPGAVSASNGSDDDAKIQSKADMEVLKSLSGHLWPSRATRADATEIKARVLASVGLLIGSKLINPYINV